MEPTLEPPDPNQIADQIKKPTIKSSIFRTYSDRLYPFLLTGLVISSFGLLLGTFIRLFTTVTTQPATNQPPINQPVNQPVTNPEVGITPNSSNPNPDVISLAKFEQIQNGMNIQQVQKLIGSEGKLLGSSNTGNTTGNVYWWQNPQGSNAMVEFRNNQVVSKSQAGLQ